MKVSAKNAAELGALSKDDAAIIVDQIGTPTGIQGLITSDESLLSRLDAFIANSGRTVDKSAGVLGIVPSAKKPPVAPAASQTATMGGKQYRVSADGKSWEEIK
jgi:hypothetical protein